MEVLGFVRSSMKFCAVLLAVVGVAAAAGCGDDDRVPGADGRDGANGQDGEDGDRGPAGPAGPQGEDGDTGETGATGDTGATGPVGEDGDDGRNAGDLDFGVAAAFPLSNLGHDRLYAATYDEDGNLFVAGLIADDVVTSADSSFVVAKILPSGELDESFGDEGIARVNVAEGGALRELARGIVVQSSGAIVIVGQAEHDTSVTTGLFADDLDIYLARFDADGVIDVSFGEDGNGIVQIDLNDGIEGVNNDNEPALVGADSVWSLSLADGDKLVVHASQRALGNLDNGMPRTDADFALLRLTADGALDTTFNATGTTPGVVTLDLEGADDYHAGASARAATVLADDSVVGFGYVTSTILGSNTQQPLVYKVDATGAFDAAFADGGDPDGSDVDGVWHGFAVDPTLRAEAYGGAVVGTNFVTMGYGPTPTAGGMGTDWVSFRFTADGDLDTTYGVGGRTYIDAGGYGDNGRFVMALPDGRVLGAGAGRAMPEEPLPEGEAPEADAMVAILLSSGMPDTSFAPGGFQLYDMGGTADHFWGGAVSPDGTRAAVIGIAGADPADSDDDAALLLLRLPED
jgi:uncharacterized delta-60 repeat protein